MQSNQIKKNNEHFHTKRVLQKAEAAGQDIIMNTGYHGLYFQCIWVLLRVTVCSSLHKAAVSGTGHRVRGTG